MKKQFLLVLDGPMGAGKTSTSQLLRKNLSQTAVLSWDTIKLFISDFGERGTDWEAIDALMLLIAEYFIAKGYNILIDGGFSRGELLQPFFDLAEKNNYHLFIYRLSAPHKLLAQRARERVVDQAERKGLTENQILDTLAFYADHKYIGPNIVTIESGTLKTEEIAEKILEDIRRYNEQ